MRISLLNRLLLAFVILPLHSVAGDLQPATSPASTMKTLSQVEPRTLITNSDLPLTITSPGSYYLAENLTYSQTTGSAIVIAASNVTLDFNGFTLSGQGPSAAKQNYAIRSTTSTLQWNSTIRNGRITGFGGSAIYLNNSCTVRDMQCSNLGLGAVWLGHNGLVTDCSFDRIGYSQQTGSTQCTVIDLLSGTVQRNRIYDVNVLSGDVIVIRQATQVTDNFIYSIVAKSGNITTIETGGLVQNNVISSLHNFSTSGYIRGIVSSSGIVSNNTLSHLNCNAGDIEGIRCLNGARITGNQLQQFYGYGSAITLRGLYCGKNVSASDNQLSSFHAITGSNTLHGIVAGNANTIRGNSIVDMSMYSGKYVGILASNNCRIMNNHVGYMDATVTTANVTVQYAIEVNGKTNFIADNSLNLGTLWFRPSSYDNRYADNTGMLDITPGTNRVWDQGTHNVDVSSKY